MKSLGLLILIPLLAMSVSAQRDDLLPEFEVWVECIERGPFEGRAFANLSYRYTGEFALLAEDSRYFGDTVSGETIVFPFTLQPGDHPRFERVNVGALKVAVWKIVVFNEVYVVAMYDDPNVPDCPIVLADPTPAPTPIPDPQV